MSRDRREENTDCKVYCGGLPADATSQELEDSFNRYGPIRKVWIARKPPGFAFIEFEDSRDADDAVRGLDGGRVCGGRVHVELSRGRGGGRRGGGDYRGGGGGDYRGGRGGGGGGRYSGGASGSDRGGRHSRSRSPPARRDARHSPKRTSRSPRPSNGSKGNNDRRRSPSVSPPPRGSPPIRRASPPAARSRSVSAD